MREESGYIPCMKKWVHIIIHEPVSWMMMSLWFLLCSLPLVTVGVGWTFILLVAKTETEENKWKATRIWSSFLHSSSFWKSFCMGIIDILLLLSIGLSFKNLIATDTFLLYRFMNALFIWFDTLLFLSSIYRYPLLAEQPSIQFIRLYSDSILLCLTNVKLTLLISMAIITIILLSTLIGITLFLFLPGGLALLVTITFNQMDNPPTFTI